MKKEDQRTVKAREKYVGKVFKTNTSEEVTVLEYVDSYNIEVVFTKTGNKQWTTASALKTGILKDSAAHKTHSYGVMDLPKSVGRKGNCDPSYHTWNNMLQRCYNENLRHKHVTYKGCTVSDSFKYFSKFKKWYDKQVGHDVKGWHLDKDILVKGNKLYSAETCCLLPPEINCALVTSGSRRGQHPQGVIYNSTKTRYRARIQRGNKWESLGAYDTPEEAFAAYKPAKEAHIKSLANKWKDQIDVRVYDALMNWTIEITD